MVQVINYPDTLAKKHRRNLNRVLNVIMVEIDKAVETMEVRNKHWYWLDCVTDEESKAFYEESKALRLITLYDGFEIHLLRKSTGKWLESYTFLWEPGIYKELTCFFKYWKRRFVNDYSFLIAPCQSRLEPI